MKCRQFYTIDKIMEAEEVPTCECGGIIKPDVVLYEEGLDDERLSPKRNESRCGHTVWGNILRISIGSTRYYSKDKINK